MRKLSEIDKRILDNILECGCDKLSAINTIASPLFVKGQHAILIMEDVYLLSCDDANTSSINSQMISFISLIKELQKEGYVYLVNTSDKQLLIQNGISSELWCTEGVYATELGVIEHLDNSRIHITSSKKDYSGIAYPKEYSDTLKYILTSDFCPTTELEKFKKNGYVSDELARYKRDLFYTRLGLVASFVALLVSLIHPFFLTRWQTKYQTDYNNDNAFCTVNEVQHNDYINNMQTISTSLDSLLKDVRLLNENISEKQQRKAPFRIKQNSGK